MFDAVKDKAVLLMEFDQYLLEKQVKENPETAKRLIQMPAVQMLVKNTEAIPASTLTGCRVHDLQYR